MKILWFNSRRWVLVYQSVAHVAGHLRPYHLHSSTVESLFHIPIFFSLFFFLLLLDYT